MKKIPNDFFMSPSAVSVTCTEVPVGKLPTKFLPESKVSKLILAGLLLKDVLKELFRRVRAPWVVLQLHTITNLPTEMEELKKLKIFHLLGSYLLNCVVYRPQWTAVVMLGWSLNLTAFFLVKIRPAQQLNSANSSPVTDTCPSWISGRERMTVEYTDIWDHSHWKHGVRLIPTW